MKVILILALVALAAAAPQYGVPEAPKPIYGQPVQEVGKVHRHVYVHVAPQDEEDNQTKVIRVPGGHDKHVNIIFVKAPSTSFGSNTEIELPQQNEQKTLVYVLLKKPDSASDLKIRGPAPTRPSKPEVFFIRYKDAEKQQAAGGYGPAPVPVEVQKPSGTYGTPF